jgi:hypothetical protein
LKAVGKAPNAKLQAPEKLQYLKHQSAFGNTSPIQVAAGQIGAWYLGFLWSLELEAWSF